MLRFTDVNVAWQIGYLAAWSFMKGALSAVHVIISREIALVFASEQSRWNRYNQYTEISHDDKKKSKALFHDEIFSIGSPVAPQANVQNTTDNKKRIKKKKKHETAPVETLTRQNEIGENIEPIAKATIIGSRTRA